MAFANLNPATTISVPAGTYLLTINGGFGEGFNGDNSIGDLDITATNTSIVGAGAATTIIQQTQPNDRVIEVNPFLDAAFVTSISDVTIRGGKETTAVGGGGIIGGSIDNALTVTNCVLSGNSATGAGTFGGGGISFAGGNLTVSGTTFSSNSTSGSGGAVGYTAGDPLARTPSVGVLTVTSSTFSNNSAASAASGGGALDLFSFNLGTGSYSITSSSFQSNTATSANGGAILVESGGPLTVTTSAFTNNTAGTSGGAVFSNASVATIRYSRFVGNSVPTPTNGLTLFRGSGLFTADDDWWGVNTGPGSNDFRSASGTIVPVTYLQLRASANPNTICVGDSSSIVADIKQRNAGPALTVELNGLPPFPATFTNNTPAVGNLTGASADFVDGQATATFTATAAGTGLIDVIADNQSATASVLVQNDETTDPADQMVCEGGTASFTTNSSGPGSFTYVWKKGATVLNTGDLGGRVTIVSGANNSTLSIVNAQPSDADTYTVEATGSCSTATQTATLTINAATTTTDPVDQTVCQGAIAGFSTTASGTGPFSYAWTLDGSPFGGNTASINVDTTALSVGNHTVEVTTTGACGSAMQSATLTVQAGTTTTDPADQTVCKGAIAGFSTTASGTGPFSYAWTVDGLPFGGNTASISVDTAALSVGSHTVAVTTTGSCGSASQSATLTVQANTTTTDPADQTVCQGAMAAFSTTASGTGPFSYAWTIDGSAFGGDTASINVDTTALSVGNHTVTVTTTGACGSASQSATLTVQANTTTTDPADQTVCQGATASFSTTASGTGPFQYAWTVDGSPFGGDTDSINVPTSSMTIGSHTVTVTTTGSCGSATQTASLTVQENTATTDPGDQTVCQGATASFSTTASGTGPFHYAWTVDGTAFGGDTANINVPTGAMTAGSHTVTVTTTGECGSATQSATLTVNTAPAVTQHPQSQTVTNGGNVTFTAAASGQPTPTVQWQVSTNGGASFSDIPGATNTSLTFATNSSQNGNQYRAVFTNECGTATTTAATLTTCTPAEVTSHPQSVADACVGSVVTFSASASGFPTPTVQWQVSTNGGGTWTNISGATSPTLNVTASVAVRNNQYRAVFTNDCGTATTNPATLGVDTIAPVITLNNNTITLWPPNHSYHTINVADLVASVSDNCSSNLLNSVVIASVSSDESENGNGDGNTLNDIVIAADCKTVQLRAERQGGGNGRVYRINFAVTDSAGNTSTATGKVYVPKNANSTAVDNGPAAGYTVTGACP